MAARQDLDEHFSCRGGKEMAAGAAGRTQNVFREELDQFTGL